MVRENKTYTIDCECGEEVTVNAIDNARDAGWIVKSNFSIRKQRDEYDKILCPKCVEQDRLRKYNSDDIDDRLSAGYYKDHPDKFRDDAIESVGLKGNPKAEKAFSKAYDDGHHGGYYEVLSALRRYAEILL